MPNKSYLFAKVMEDIVLVLYWVPPWYSVCCAIMWWI